MLLSGVLAEVEGDDGEEAVAGFGGHEVALDFLELVVVVFRAKESPEPAAAALGVLDDRGGVGEDGDDEWREAHRLAATEALMRCTPDGMYWMSAGGPACGARLVVSAALIASGMEAILLEARDGQRGGGFTGSDCVSRDDFFPAKLRE